MDVGAANAVRLAVVTVCSTVLLLRAGRFQRINLSFSYYGSLFPVFKSIFALVFRVVVLDLGT